MKPRALVVEDDPAIVNDVAETLASLGHSHDAADSMDAARHFMDAAEYTYFLVDLEIPVHSGRGFARIENGVNLIDEIIRKDSESKRRIIVITAHGNDGPHQAVEIMKKGIADYVPKPFPTSGERTLDKAIRRMLAGHDTETLPGDQQTKDEPPAKHTKFVGGEMVFFRDRVELCGTDICSGRRTIRQRRALELLRATAGGGSRGGYSCEELAEQLRMAAKDVPGLIRQLRERIRMAVRTKVCIDCGLEDVIMSGGPGFRLSQRVAVQDGVDADRKADHGQELDNHRVDVPNRVPNVPDPHVPNLIPDDARQRREWIIRRLEGGHQLQAPHVAEKFKCSKKTAQRDLAALRAKIEFVGSPRTGHYRLRRQSGTGDQSC